MRVSSRVSFLSGYASHGIGSAMSLFVQRPSAALGNVHMKATTNHFELDIVEVIAFVCTEMVNAISSS
jgi:hypothetical protein